VGVYGDVLLASVPRTVVLGLLVLIGLRPNRSNRPSKPGIE
jgi:hypothetical protein